MFMLNALVWNGHFCGTGFQPEMYGGPPSLEKGSISPINVAMLSHIYIVNNLIWTFPLLYFVCCEFNFGMGSWLKSYSHNRSYRKPRFVCMQFGNRTWLSRLTGTFLSHQICIISFLPSKFQWYVMKSLWKTVIHLQPFTIRVLLWKEKE